MKKLTVILLLFLGLSKVGYSIDRDSSAFLSSYRVSLGLAYSEEGFLKNKNSLSDSLIKGPRRTIIGEANFIIRAGVNFELFQFLTIRPAFNYQELSYHSIYKNGLYVGFDGFYPIYTSGYFRYKHRLIHLSTEFQFNLSKNRDGFYLGFGVEYGKNLRSYFINGKKVNSHPKPVNPDEFFVSRGFSSFFGYKKEIKDRLFFIELRYGNYNFNNNKYYYSYLYNVNFNLGCEISSRSRSQKIEDNKKFFVPNQNYFLLSPAVSYTIPKAYYNYQNYFTCNWATSLSYFTKFKNGIIGGLRLSYLNQNSIYRNNGYYYYYNCKYVNESFIDAMALIQYDLLRKSVYVDINPSIGIGGGKGVLKNIKDWEGELVGIFPPKNVDKETTIFWQNKESALLVSLGLKSLFTIYKKYKIGFGFEYNWRYFNVPKWNYVDDFMIFNVDFGIILNSRKWF